MPPKVEQPKTPTNPPDSNGRFTFDVTRIGESDAGDNQLFRFTLEVIKVWRALPAGGTLSVVRQKRTATTLFSLQIPDQQTLTDAEKSKLKFVAELTVHGSIPVKHDRNNYFALHWVPTPAAAQFRPADHVDYTYDIAAFKRRVR
jgi:hypothetical protein